MPSRFLEVIKGAGAQSDPEEALRILVNDCIVQTAATAGRLYLLSLAQTAFLQVLPPTDGERTPPNISLLAQERASDNRLLQGVIRSREVLRIAELTQQPMGQIGSYRARSRLLVPMVRGRVCIGILDLDSDHSNHFTQEHEDTVQVAAIVALLLCEKNNALNLLKELPTPVDYHQHFEHFLHDIMVLVAKASRMPCGILRELRDDSLYCLKCYGFKDILEDDLHLSPVEDFPTFKKVLETRKTVIEPDASKKHIKELLSHLDKIKGIKSFIVVPLLVGTEVYGTLSFALFCEHAYTELERSGLETIANSVGVAIANYRNFHLADERIYEEARIGSAITAGDIAQAARHEARNHIQTCQEKLALLVGLVAGGTAKQREQGHRLIGEISQKMKDSDLALEKIKTATKVPESEKVLAQVETLWNEAFSLVTGRLQQLHVRTNVKGSATARVAKDYMRHAFLQIILNSIDAFKESKRKKDRCIDVTIDPQSDKAQDFVIRYVDNTMGIDPSKLVPALEEGVRSVNDIFNKGVSSKTEGSGYGMYLVRKILAEHNGSIEILDYRTRVVFDIKLPKPS